MEEFKLSISKDDAAEIYEISKNYALLEDPINKTKNIQGRHQFNKDYARVLYSSSFRRLQGKMQFLSIASNRFYRNRLTHSHEVSQIARTIADALKRSVQEYGFSTFSMFDKGMYVIEAISLAHDIGNPPFGHAGESILNKLMAKDGGYEGNAQTFRVLNKLERRYPNEDGLFLSKRSLLGVVKYINSKNDNEKFLYEDDLNLVLKIGQEANVNLRTIDAQIMDVADEIAYAAHDLEDALKAKIFTIDELLFEFQNHKKYNCAYAHLKDIVEKCKIAAETSKSTSSEDYMYFFTKELTSKIVDCLVKDIGFVEMKDKDKEKTGSQNSKEINYKTLEMLSEGLKKINFQCVTKSPSVIIYEKKGNKVIKELFGLFSDESNQMLLPPEYRTNESESERRRLVCDYISGMMDTFAIETYKEYFGQNSLDKLM